MALMAELGLTGTAVQPPGQPQPQPMQDTEDEPSGEIDPGVGEESDQEDDAANET
jgi:hypothetical protein